MPDITINLNFAGRQLVLNIDQSQPVHLHIVTELQQKGMYEPATQMFLLRVLRPGDTFVDVGAHFGYFSLIAAAMVKETGRVIAVEPTQENYRRLAEHFAVNDLTSATAVNCAINDYDGDVTFYLNADNDGGHALWDVAEHPANERTRAAPAQETVSCKTLASLFAANGCEHVRLMKIDTEGAETKILKSAGDFLSSGKVDFILAEVNAGGLIKLGSDVDDMFRTARDLGFVLLLPDEQGLEPRALLSTNLPDPRYVYNVVLARPEALATL